MAESEREAALRDAAQQGQRVRQLASEFERKGTGGVPSSSGALEPAVHASGQLRVRALLCTSLLWVETGGHGTDMLLASANVRISDLNR